MNEHLDLDALADALAGDEPPHLATCPSCQAALEELRAATEAVAADLAALPDPPVPADLEARITAALAATAAPAPTTTVLPAGDVTPLAPRRTVNWGAVAGLAAGAVAILALVGGGLLLTGSSNDSGNDSTAAKTVASGPPISSTARDYTDATLAAAVPGLLRGPVTESRALSGAASGSTKDSSGVAGAPAPQAASADPLAGLRDAGNLASCLASLTDPAQTSLPLALDYASYKHRPALVVVLPAAKAGKVDVWVVGPGCSQAESDLLYYARVDRPAP